MAYIGKTPTVGNFVKLDALTASATASYTMQVDSVNFSPESVNHMLVSLNGVIQSPTTSYTISGSTITFASALTSSDSIDFIMVYGNVLDIGTPSDATVTNAKTNFVSTSSAAGLQIKGDGTTDGTLQLNCSQNSHGIKLKSPAHSTSSSYTLTFPGTDPSADKFLKTDGSGNLSFADAGGSAGLNLVTSFTPSSEGSTIVVDNCFTATYDRYLVFCERLRNGVGSARLDVYLRTGGSSGSDSCNLGGAYLGYRYNNQYMSGSINNSCQGTIASNVEQDRWYNAMMYFIQPYDSAYTTNIQGQSAYREGSTGNYGFINFGYQPDNTDSHTGFAIQLSTGNFNQTSSTIKVYGIVDS